jgi:hypothetical protein
LIQKNQQQIFLRNLNSEEEEKEALFAHNQKLARNFIKLQALSFYKKQQRMLYYYLLLNSCVSS